MSHTATIQVDVKDAEVVRRAAERLGITCSEGSVELFSTKHTGLLIQLPDWKYPICIDTESEWDEEIENSDGTKTTIKRRGHLFADNYSGTWGKQDELDKFLQAYGVEKAKHEASAAGYLCSEESFLNPETGLEEIEVTISLPGAGASGDYDGGLNLGGNLSLET